jgi:hypothetical protein
VRVASIEWDKGNEAHFAENGRASREQVEDVLLGRYHPARKYQDDLLNGEVRFRFEGETRKGRFLVVIAAQRPKGTWRPITCWTLSGGRLKNYQAWRKTVRR